MTPQCGRNAEQESCESRMLQIGPPETLCKLKLGYFLRWSQVRLVHGLGQFDCWCAPFFRQSATRVGWRCTAIYDSIRPLAALLCPCGTAAWASEVLKRGHRRSLKRVPQEFSRFWTHTMPSNLLAMAPNLMAKRNLRAMASSPEVLLLHFERPGNIYGRLKYGAAMTLAVWLILSNY